MLIFPHATNINMPKFVIFKGFSMNIHPSAPSCIKDILRHPPPLGWTKGNFDSIAAGNPSLATCGRIFQKSNGDHLGSFSNFIGQGDAITYAFIGAMIVVELDVKKNTTLFCSNSTVCLLCTHFLIPLS